MRDKHLSAIFGHLYLLFALTKLFEIKLLISWLLIFFNYLNHLSSGQHFLKISPIFAVCAPTTKLTRCFGWNVLCTQKIFLLNSCQIFSTSKLLLCVPSQPNYVYRTYTCFWKMFKKFSPYAEKSDAIYFKRPVSSLSAALQLICLR